MLTMAIPDVEILAFACSQHVHSMFLLYSPHKSNVFDSRTREFDGV